MQAIKPQNDLEIEKICIHLLAHSSQMHQKRWKHLLRTMHASNPHKVDVACLRHSRTYPYIHQDTFTELQHELFPGRCCVTLGVSWLHRQCHDGIIKCSLCWSFSCFLFLYAFISFLSCSDTFINQCLASVWCSVAQCSTFTVLWLSLSDK